MVNVVKGMKVICINDTIPAHKVAELSKDIPHFVKKGQVYTVRDVVDYGTMVAITVEELRNPFIHFSIPGGKTLHQEPAFRLDRFAPLDQPCSVEACAPKAPKIVPMYKEQPVKETPKYVVLVRNRRVGMQNAA